MKQQITLNLVDGYKLILENRCSYMGHYYAEDDWNHTIIQETPEECIEEFWRDYPDLGIDHGNPQWTKIQYLEYGNGKLEVSKVSLTSDEIGELSNLFWKHPNREPALKLEKEKIQKQKDLKEKQDKLDKETRERALLSELKNKYK